MSEEFARSLVGIPEDRAKAKTESSGYVWRVGSRDGTSYPMTMDYTEWRVTVAIKDGTVESATIG